MKKPALHESLWFSHWVPSKWMQLTDFPNSVPSNSGFIKLGLISSRWNVQVSVDAQQTCEWQVAVINSSLQSDTVRRDSGFWRSHTAAQGGCLQGRWWHQHCPRITCPPSPSTCSDTPAPATNTSLKFYQAAIYALSWDSEALCEFLIRNGSCNETRGKVHPGGNVGVIVCVKTSRFNTTSGTSAGRQDL